MTKDKAFTEIELSCFFLMFAAMLRKGIHKVFSLLMALMVLLSTVSFTIGKHFCGDELMNISMFVQADHCGMELETTNAITLNKKTCCSDETEVVQGQNTLQLSTFEDFHFEQQYFLTSFIYSYTNLFEGLPEQIIPHKGYSPPNLIADIQVLDQVFVI